MRRVCGLAVLVSAFAACMCAPALAGLNTVGPNGPLTFQSQLSPLGVSWSMTGVPDIDQARGTNAAGTKVGLPNGGYMYCVPTTGMDFLAYLADRGFAGSLGVPSKDWTLATNFNEMSVLLAQLGGEMGTDPVGGTGGDGFVAAMTKRLADSEIGVVQVQYYALDGQGGEPTVSDVIQSGADGDLLSAGIGFYSDEMSGGKAVKRRVGGHAFAIVGGSGLPSSKAGTVLTRDPAIVYTADTVQGPYTTDTHTVKPLSTTVIYTGDDGVDHTYAATLATWDDSTTTLFEGFTRIVPKTTWVGLGKKLEQLIPQPLVPGPGPVEKVYEVPGDGSVKAIALSAETDAPAFLVQGSNNVYSLDPLSGQTVKLGSVPGAQALTYGGPAQRLYVAGAQQLVALDRTGHVVDARKLTSPINALSFDQTSGRIAGVSKGKLLLFDPQLHPVASRAVPAVQRPGAGAPLVAFGPKGNLVAGNAGQGSISQSKVNAVVARSAKVKVQATATTPAAKLPLTSRPLQGGGKVRGLAVDDLGQVIVSVGGKLRVFSAGGRRLATSPFDGLPGNGVVAVTRSFDNTAGTPFLKTLDRTVGPPPAPEAPPPAPPAPLPDLVVSGVDNAPTILVRNIGAADAGPFDVRIDTPTGASQTMRFPAGLAAGAVTAVTRLTCVPGRTFTVDASAEVAESNEANNTFACGS